VKSSIISSFAVMSALTGCSLQSAAPLSIAMATEAPADPSNSPSNVDYSKGFASSALGDDTYEMTYSGRWLGSRDAVEGRLLYRSALLARAQGKSWFRFLHLPGEDGPLSHPSRSSPSFGAAFGHWQPHWNYWSPLGLQPWHPERGRRFWGDTEDAKGVERVEVHAMIKLGEGPFAAAEQTDFDVSAVLRDLRPAFH
jgi:hypothetical protein